MRIFDLAIKDLSQMFRDKRSLLFLVVMPIGFTFFMGFAFGGSSTDAQADTRIPLAVVNADAGSDISNALMDRLVASESIRVESMSEESAMRAYQQNDVAGVLTIPGRFAQQARVGEEPQITLMTDSTTADGQSLYQILRVPISQLMSSIEISKEVADLLASDNASTEQNYAFKLAWSKWTFANQYSLVKLEQATAGESEDAFGGNPYNQSSPGILVQFAIFGLVTSAQMLVQEKKTRALQRMITTSMRPWEIVLGHLLAMFTITFMQVALLVLFGQLMLGVDYLHEPVGVLLVSVVLSLWVATIGLLIGVIAREEQQVIMYSLIAMFLFSALGGAWFPLEATGGGFAALGKLMPSTWAMTGYQNILIRGLGLESLWMPLGALFGYAMLFFVLAIWRFGYIKSSNL